MVTHTLLKIKKQAEQEILEMVKSFNPDVFIAGPAFNAGRYGTACGAIGKLVQEHLNIPVVSGMYIENPGCRYVQERHLYNFNKEQCSRY